MVFHGASNELTTYVFMENEKKKFMENEKKKYRSNTGQLRYLEFQGNGENTSSFPKFEIANYDVTRIHVHEEKKSPLS